MAEAAVNQDTEIIAKGPGVFTQAGSLVSQVQRMYSQPAFQRSLCLLYTSDAADE